VALFLQKKVQEISIQAIEKHMVPWVIECCVGALLATDRAHNVTLSQRLSALHVGWLSPLRQSRSTAQESTRISSHTLGTLPPYSRRYSHARRRAATLGCSPSLWAHYRPSLMLTLGYSGPLSPPALGTLDVGIRERGLSPSLPPSPLGAYCNSSGHSGTLMRLCLTSLL
jgi:hypothetical protein